MFPKIDLNRNHYLKRYWKIIQINIFDKADNVRKLHKNNVALFGGVILFYNLFIFILLDFYFKIELLNIHFNTRELFSLILGINLFAYVCKIGSIRLDSHYSNLNLNNVCFTQLFSIKSQQVLNCAARWQQHKV